MDENPSVDKIIQRAIALQIIIDRGWSDHYSKNGSKTSMIKNQRVRKKIDKWVEKESLFHYFTEKEKEIFYKPLGDLTQEEISFCTWQLERLIPLLWTLGLISYMPNHFMHGADEHYGLLFFVEENPIEKIKNVVKLYDNEDVNQKADSYMLAHWRCRELSMGRTEKIRIKDIVPKIFGEWIESSLNEFVYGKNGDFHIGRFNREINELDAETLGIIREVVMNRQHALNWLTGQDEEWDEITLDT